MTQKELARKLKNDAYRFGYEYAVGMMEGFISRIECCENTWDSCFKNITLNTTWYREELLDLLKQLEQIKEDYLKDDIAIYVHMRMYVESYPYSAEDDECVQDGIYDAVWGNMLMKVKYQYVPKQADQLIETINRVMRNTHQM